ncbi:hypothetical protein [Hymenobacter armeniacus]|uniref:Gram-positive cocci surface proteins LPxTG domain-containing protein n=1 Tax=Hymenobacter armeniacus TaxID=2771358 RepID=A0ABR8JXT6_9BACT|nr:hypothetical protein [Hymenobacter armeniacus]MBD2723362.1 hypothetical protein [Hymenobacter armeniacus]
MKKTKKNKAAKKATLLGGATKSLKKLGKGKGLGKLSTTQKVVGGAALVALGLSYLSKRRAGKAAEATAPTSSTSATSDALAAEESLAAMDGNA